MYYYAFIWTGYGLVAGLASALPVLMYQAARRIPTPGASEAHPYGQAALGFALAGVVCLLAGRALNGHWVKGEHTYFFLPVQVWGVIYFALAGVVFHSGYKVDTRKWRVRARTEVSAPVRFDFNGPAGVGTR
jgi:hypothetical protein